MLGRLLIWLQAPGCEIDASALGLAVRAGYVASAASAGDK
jgi:hypothetical protein